MKIYTIGIYLWNVLEGVITIRRVGPDVVSDIYSVVWAEAY